MAQRRSRRVVEPRQVAALSIVSVAVAVLGTLIIFGGPAITGYNAAGTVTLSITDSVGCNLVDPNVDFQTAIAHGQSANSYDAATASNRFLDLNNTGNTNLSVSLYETDGTGPFAGCTIPNSCYQVNCNESGTSSGCQQTMANVGSSSGTATSLHTNLGTMYYGATASGMNISFAVTVPSFEPNGTKSSGVTVSCSGL